MIKHNKNRFVPLFISLGVIVGILIGSFFANHFSGNRLSIINNSSNKILDLFHLIDDQYVDSVNIPDLVEKSMPQILKELDPHSTYISAAKVEESMQDLKGSFSGIGIQFTLYKDTIRVVKVVKGGPSESVGIQAGDRIINIDGKAYVGDTISNDGTMLRLKGPKGSVARLGVKRAGQPRTLTFNITRGDVPVKTVDAAYMAAPGTGYIRITGFGDTTYAEFIAALTKLQTQGFAKLIIDLRGNPGGYMETAVQLANEFLAKNSLIVYTKGRKSPRKEYRTDGRGAYQNLPLVVLVDETSASASEIFAGAIQDNDRGTIIGRRSFGKGLVQRPLTFEDGSEIRLTIAHYYTPSGRCIQKPYKKGDREDYALDLDKRYKHGEFTNQDSIHLSDSLKYYTLRKHRVVYGGGGIMPDYFVPLDTTKYTKMHRLLTAKSIVINHSLKFIDAHRQELKSQYKDFGKFLASYEVPQSLVDEIIADGKKEKIEAKDEAELAQTKKYLAIQLKALVARDIWDMSQYFQVWNETNEIVMRAVKLLTTGK